MSGGTWTFDLPLPPSKNERPNSRASISFDAQAKRRIWATALEQHTATTEPPGMVEIAAEFRVGNTWDHGNLVGALYAYVLDALQRPPPGAPPPNWRRGIAERKGFLVDDSPRHCRLGSVTQRIERDPRLRGLRLRLVRVEAGAPEHPAGAV